MGDDDDKLNDNLGDFIDCLAAVEGSPEGANSWRTWTEENWEEEFDKHPFFRKKPIEPGEELSPEMEAMMAMKWDIDDPDEKAEEYKKEGNQMFKLKKYRFAIISYTEGIKMRAKNNELTAILYANRAAAHVHLENFRSALSDCVFARKFQPRHSKAINRGIEACLRLSMFGEAIKWCDAALILNPLDESALTKRKDAEKRKKIQDRDKRKKDLDLKKERARKLAMVEAVKSRGLIIGDVADLDASVDFDVVDSLDLSALETHHPSGAQVAIREDGRMIWPVMFLYPEYGETDFIEAFNESDIFENHLILMFGEVNRPPWDVEGKYLPDNLLLFYEDKLKTKLISVSKQSSLLEALQQKNFRIYGGTPTFIVLPNACKFLADYLKHYERSTS